MFTKMPIVQYISQGATPDEHMHSIKRVLEGGCKWIQLRLKNTSDKIVEIYAKKALELCLSHDAVFILNDYVQIGQKIGAHGVHIGQKDMSIQEAREILGKNKIIGLSTNTIEDIHEALAVGADYVGLGPFHFTTTKDKLSPILGIKGYTEIMKELHNQGIKLPVVAIGGIQLADIAALRKSGVDGIAVSGLLANIDNTKEIIDAIHEDWSAHHITI